ncbi:L,D-transpeptidase family protein [Rhodopseudomonas palustris]|uniref:L,D-transpeptidase family protein n=2 Tax=Thiospirillum jenense TaxID=1653858 RepID=A0A839HF35_9GAMM|nr:L,D-transpeptidase family protein [Rhodopseudomonas palustris]MBB1127271.1 L,D-transpeptidase family protein [Thiospirillum jenense]
MTDDDDVPLRHRRWAVAVLATALVTLAPPGTAEVYQLANPQDSVIGKPFYLQVSADQTLLDVGRRYGLGFDEMKAANPGVDMWVPKANADVMVPAQQVLPAVERQGIVLNIAEKRLYYFRSPTEIESFAVGTGRDGWETPVGNYKIISKVKDPTWTPTESVRKEHAAAGDILPAVVPAGPDNPLGAYAMRLDRGSYLIHGTNKPWGVGMQVSHGCTRMYPEDVEHLFGEVEIGTPVMVVNQPYKIGWLGDTLYLEVNAYKEEMRQKPVEEIIPAEIANADGVRIDWEEVRRVRDENAGLPRVIGGRQGSTSWHYLDMIF